MKRRGFLSRLAAAVGGAIAAPFVGNDPTRTFKARWEERYVGPLSHPQIVYGRSRWTRCVWKFRGNGCGYKGPKVRCENICTGEVEDDGCEKTIEACADRGNEVRFGGWYRG